MLTTQDVMENKKRYAKLETTSFQHFRAAVLDSEKKGVREGERNKRFLNLPDAEIYKWLKLAEGSFSKRLDDQMHSLRVLESKTPLDMKVALAVAAEKGEVTDAVFEEICEHIEKSYGFLGKILVVAFVEFWDVPEKAKDGKTLEDGERVSKRILVTICPVGLTSPGLEFKLDEDAVTNADRKWMVGKPETAFLWPSWENREDRKDRIMYFCADPTQPHHKFITEGLGCADIETATEARKKFENMILQTEEDGDAGRAYLQQIKDAIEEYYQEAQNVPFPSPEMLMARETFEEVLIGAQILDEELVDEYDLTFREKPKMKWLVSEKDIAEAEKRRNKKRLSSLMKDAARELKKLSNGDTELAKRLIAEAEKNERRSK